MEQIDNETYLRLYQLASGERKKKADRYRDRDDSKRCIAADLLLRAALLDTKQIRMPGIGYGAHGKPYVEAVEGFCYNLSHSGTWVVLGYSDNEIGIDIEQVYMTEARKRVAAISFSPEEQNYIFEATGEEEEALRFSRVWTAKESYLKYLGTGLSRGMSSFSVDVHSGCVKDAFLQDEDIRINSLFPGKGYCISACGKYNGMVVNMVKIEELLERLE
ncbi:MAG: 4'-phosphopantetheinyl transferase superfamily protein [Lachnospiraceae bacterium]|nr:4'-phosphopantetheinyl transferase superfamily protein [Lachnospiraceae bacterium]